MSARCAAAEILIAVLERGRTLEDALAATPSFAALEGRERGFARAIATASLRRLGRIDHVITHFLNRPLHESAGLARALLRTGATQMLALGTPAHAAVGETVEVAMGARAARPFARLINAVLRKVAREGPALFAAAPVGADLPAWLFARWRAAYGDVEAARIAAALWDAPALDLTVKRDAQAWAERLGGALLPTGSVRLSPSVGVGDLDGYGEGAWWVQDAASALPARLLGDIAGKTVLDLCAAPGGKTLQLAAAGAHVTALDRSAARLEALKQNLSRTRLSAEIICADALDYRPNRLFDCVLLDAPCTATGTLRRHPDIAWLRRPSDIAKLAELQARLLRAASAMLAPRGSLVYAVCSLEPEEGSALVEAALREGAWTRAPIREGEIPGADAFITPEGALRTLPSHWPEYGGLDGFYAARLVRC